MDDSRLKQISQEILQLIELNWKSLIPIRLFSSSSVVRAGAGPLLWWVPSSELPHLYDEAPPSPDPITFGNAVYIPACILYSRSLNIIPPATSFPPQALACLMIPSWREGKAVLPKIIPFEETKWWKMESPLKCWLHASKFAGVIVKIKSFFIFAPS